jgi:hypothetical protein
MQEARNAYTVLIRKPEGKRPLEDLGTDGCEDIDWIHLAEDRGQWLAVVNTVMNYGIPKKLVGS